MIRFSKYSIFIYESMFIITKSSDAIEHRTHLVKLTRKRRVETNFIQKVLPE